jgi:hypothetical protein
MEARRDKGEERFKQPVFMPVLAEVVPRQPAGAFRPRPRENPKAGPSVAESLVVTAPFRSLRSANVI